MFDREQAIAEWRIQMRKAGLCNPEVLDELESHLCDEIEAGIRSGLELQQAFQAAVKQIGRADAVKSEFTKVGLTKGISMMNHNRVYTAALAVFAVYNMLIVACGVALWRIVGGQGWNEPMGHFPAWSIPWLFWITCAYTILIVWTLFARRYRPELGRQLSRVLNWLLLPVIPGGTVIGLYGMWAAYKQPKQYV